MSSLTLKEIRASKAEDQKVLELFASFREHVIHVSATHLLPDQIAVTIKNGFVELINTASGDFRLFLTYLDTIPLDAALRCFSLVPSLYAASSQHQHHLLYSLSYSNELLLANVETGVVRTLSTCASRPSVVECDGDYVVCGEGNGQVAVWRGSAEERDRVYVRGSGSSSLPPLLWRRALFNDAVVCAGVHRDQLVCCSADFGCVVASVEDGQVRASLSTELDRGVAAFALTRPARAPGRGVLAVCQASRISVFAVGPPSASPLTPRQEERWTYRGGCVVEGTAEVACASCLGSYLAIGTRSGLVMLFDCDAAAQQVKELVRFNVGYGVKGTQLFADETLLVVTSAGDVWRWPLCDLLNSTEQHASPTEDEEEEPEPAPVTGTPPEPAAAPDSKSSGQLGRTLPSRVVAPATPHEVSCTQEGDAEDRNLSVQDTSVATALATQTERAPEEGNDDSTAAESTVNTFAAREEMERGGVTSVHLSSLPRGEDTYLLMSEDEDAPAAAEGSVDAEARPSEPSTALELSTPPIPSAFARMQAVANDAINKPVPTRKSPAYLYEPENITDKSVNTQRKSAADNASTVACPAETSHCESAGGLSPPSSADTTAHIDVSAQAASGRRRTPSQGSTRVDKIGLAGALPPPARKPLVLENDPGRPTLKGNAAAASPLSKEALELARLEGEFDQAMARVLGPAVSVEGLRRGRRMDPRKVANVLHNMASQPADTTLSAVKAPPALAGLNSTKLLEEKRAFVAAAAFDFDAYRKAHRLEADALQYQHPIKSLTYTLQDRIFDGVEAVARIRSANIEDGGIVAVQNDSAPPPSQDELRDVLQGRVRRFVDPGIAEERRQGGPELAHHRCDDLLFPAFSAARTVLFQEKALLPSTAWEEVLLLPMPLPPASSVF